MLKTPDVQVGNLVRQARSPYNGTGSNSCFGGTLYAGVMDRQQRGPQRKRRLWLLLALVALLALGLTGAVLWRTPQGQAFRNVAEYRLRAWWWSRVGQPTYDPARTGGLSGLVQDTSGTPLAGAIVLVSTVRGEVYQARTDRRGRYRIDGVPPGRYVPLAAARGYEETTGPPVRVEAGRVHPDVRFNLRRYRPPDVVPTNLRVGPPQEATSEFPTHLVATRVPFTFTLDGLTIDGGQLYLPQDARGSLPTLLIIYPSPALNWNATSVALAGEEFAVVAMGPDADRGLDIEGHVRDFRAVFQLWQEGYLKPPEGMSASLDRNRWVLMSGSFGSLILFRALRDLPPVPAIVSIGGISDAFLGVQALYSEELAIPPPYDTAIAAMGRPDRDPAFFFAYSPVFFAEHLPPTLIVHMYADEVIPYNQALALDAAMTAAGVPHDLLLYADTTHYLDPYNPTDATYMVYDRVVAFAKEHTRSGPGQPRNASSRQP